MIVKKQRKPLEQIENIMIGKCFRYGAGIYMKTDSSLRNAVNLETGECKNVADWIYVTPIEAEAVVLDD